MCRGNEINQFPVAVPPLGDSPSRMPSLSSTAHLLRAMTSSMAARYGRTSWGFLPFDFKEGVSFAQFARVLNS